jgi:hypothetical protein
MDPIRLRGPADVLAALPYQLGYHPTDSLVVVAVRDGVIGLVARLDLPAAHDLADAAVATVEPLLRERPDSVLLVGYESEAGAARPLLDAVADLVSDAGLQVADRLVVRDGRWYSTGRAAHGPGSDGPQDVGDDAWSPLPDPSQTPAVADFVAMGVSPLPERSDLAALVRADERLSTQVARVLGRRARYPGSAFGLPPAPLPRLTDEELDRVLAVFRLGSLALWRRVCDVGEGASAVSALSVDDVADLVESLEDVELRDGVIAWLCPGTLPFDSLEPDLVDQLRSSLPPPAWHAVPPRREAVVAGRRLLARLQWLARAVPDARAAPVLTVVANVAWWLGDGTTARVALDRALEHAPSYRLARLLDRMVGLGVRPRAARRDVAATHSSRTG